MGLTLRSSAYGEREILIMLADLSKHIGNAQATSDGGLSGFGEESNHKIMNNLESVMSALIGSGTAGVLTSEHLAKVRKERKGKRGGKKGR